MLCAVQVEVDRAVTDVVTFNARARVKKERLFMPFSIPISNDRLLVPISQSSAAVLLCSLCSVDWMEFCEIASDQKKKILAS